MTEDETEQLEYLRDFDPRTVDEIPPGTRRCVYITGTALSEDGGHIPSMVYENVSGHFPLSGRNGGAPWVWGDYPTAYATAEKYNRQLGLSRQEVLDIVSSSFAQASRQGKLS